MTFGAFGGRRDGPMTMFDPRTGPLRHAGTFNNNVITMAAGCAGMDIYAEGEVLRLNTLGESLKASIEKVLEKYELTIAPKKGPCLMKNELESPFTGEQSDYPEKSITVESLSLAEDRDGRTSVWVTGQGSMIAIHFSGDNEKSFLALLLHHMLDNGIYMAQRGFMALNLELSEKHMEKFATAFDSFIGKYRQALSS